MRFRELLSATGWVVPVLAIAQDRYDQPIPAIDYRGVVAWAGPVADEGEAETLVPLVVDEEGSGEVIPLAEWRRRRCGPAGPFLACRPPVLDANISSHHSSAWCDEARRLIEQRAQPRPEAAD